jgi:hypothetical protein
MTCGCTDARLAPEDAWVLVLKGGVKAAIPHYACTLCHEWTVADADVRRAAEVLGVDPAWLVPVTLN